MSIRTIENLLAGFIGGTSFIKTQIVTPVVGTWYSLWTYGGIPGSGGIPSGNVKGKFYATTSGDTQGALRFPRPVAGDTIYLTRFAANANTVGTLILADRIWADSISPIGIPFRTNIFSGSFPRSTGIGGGDSSGSSIQIGVEVYTTMGATAATPRATVIDSNGTGDTWTCWNAIPASAVAGTFVPMYGKNASHGVRSVSNFHPMSTKTSGVWGLTAYRIIARVESTAVGIEDSIDAFTSGFPKMFTDTVPMLFWIAGTTTPTVLYGSIRYAQG
jgi:hypothetical protein